MCVSLKRDLAMLPDTDKVEAYFEGPESFDQVHEKHSDLKGGFHEWYLKDIV